MHVEGNQENNFMGDLSQAKVHKLSLENKENTMVHFSQVRVHDGKKREHMLHSS
jgi:hypothetical protein